VPRIRRWHPVSHDLIRDREFLALIELHPRLGYMWLEMLSEADRNEGRVTGSREEIEHGFAWTINPLHPWKGKHWTRVGLAYMESRGWVEQRYRVHRGTIEEPLEHFFVRNYPTFHPRREQASSPPVLPSLPLLDKPKDTPPSPSEKVAPLNGWPQDWEPLKQKILTLPFFAKNPNHIEWVADLDWWKTQDEKFSSVPCDLDHLLLAAIAYIETEGYKPRTKRALRKKLFNCMEFEAKKAERRAREERQRER